MPLLNYTTEVPAARTLGQVQEMLVKAGASAVSATYADGSPTGLHFVVPTANGPRSFALPVNSDRVYRVLRGDAKVEKRYRTEAQAERVAWRIVKDWMEAQLAIIATEMVTLEQVMLPFMHTDELATTTVYELYVAQAALGPGSGS